MTIMTKENCLRNLKYITDAFIAYDRITDAIGCSEMENGFTRLMDNMADFYQSYFGIDPENEELNDYFFQSFFELANDETDGDFKDWEAFYDYFAEERYKHNA